MPTFPPLRIGPAEVRLPLCEATAERLAKTLLAIPDEVNCQSLAETIRIDPALAYWVSINAKNAQGLPCPETLEQAAAHLADHLLEWLQSGDCSQSHDSKPEATDFPKIGPKKIAQLIRQAARQVDDNSLDASPEYYRELVDRFGQFVTDEPDDSTSEPTDGPIPDALQLLIKQATRHQKESVPGIGRTLFRLAEKLARLKRLESNFQEQLEHEKLEAMAEFAAGAGHEINNPVAVIAGRAQLFLQSETDPDRRDGLALINAQAKRVFEMIADMRLFARPPEPTFSPFDLNGLIVEVIDQVAPTYAERMVKLKRIAPLDALEIDADRDQIAVVLLAMLRNAVEAIGHDGNVEIGAELLEENQVQISLTDDGPGVDDEARRHMFDPYYSARQAGRGLGLGLSKCWRIVVTNHGGQIDVETAPGRPTRFMVVLPKDRPT
jgi:signal transduction histidine kinase